MSAHAVTATADVDDDGVVDEAVDDGSGDDRSEKPRLDVRTVGADFSTRRTPALNTSKLKKWFDRRGGKK
jgi:hypothetical protein